MSHKLNGNETVLEQDEAALRPRSTTAAEQSPLVMRFGGFGDMVLLTILLRHLYERFGKPVDLISSGAWTQPLLAGQPWLGRLYLIRSRRTPYLLSLDQRRLVSSLRQRVAGPTWFCDLGLGFDLLERGGIPSGYICDDREFKWRPDECVADRYIRLGNETPADLVGKLPPPRPASPSRRSCCNRAPSGI